MDEVRPGSASQPGSALKPGSASQQFENLMSPTNESDPVYLVTGCAGFIASRVAAQLLESGHRVVGVDNVNDYYDTSLKQHRLDQLQYDRF